MLRWLLSEEGGVGVLVFVILDLNVNTGMNTLYIINTAEAEEEVMCDTEASFIVQGLGRKYVKVPELELE